ncbi:maleylpyruvate isomerase family mycothiol-dependent enzyme [Salinibacterium sp. ZJ450]|uniref:maleylpyruvate isomerase family mycothiol-dependent enzyme n=1 Tax=Salinibacterium sp. ZJ450 TaxID=2708338 RepID=UPI001422F384|nr:maleylpyruvate isomerase family mycothiol-dependent enzyme [Salinibacterium sp. ZJ450]
MVARTDNVTDPKLAADLLLARRGQAYFSRKLNELSDAEFAEPSLLPGWSRAHVIAHVGYNARAITRLVEWAYTGVETPMYTSTAQRGEEIEFGATLPPIALRNLSAHAAVHLNVEWRDLPEDKWSATVRTAQGRLVPASETVWMRTREVWMHAIDLDNGGKFEQLPAEFVDRLLRDIVGTWSKRAETDDSIPPVHLVTHLGDVIAVAGAAGDPVAVHGTAVDLLRWATGRGGDRVSYADGSPAKPAPRWL